MRGGQASTNTEVYKIDIHFHMDMSMALREIL